MLALVIAVLAAIWLVGPDGIRAFEIVHSSVVIARTGEREPYRLRENPNLTPLGAQQMASLGSFFRSRYITSTIAEGSSPVQGIRKTSLDNSQMSVLVPDSQFTAASAQAFLQALYPPYNVSTSSPEWGTDLAAMTADGSYVQYPLDGYQYATVSTASPDDPEIVYVEGGTGCNQWVSDVGAVLASKQVQSTAARTKITYERVCGNAMNDISSSEMNYFYAYELYDFVRYQYNHNSTIKGFLSAPDLQSDLDSLQWLADQYEWALTTGPNAMTVAGKTLAAKVLDLLRANINSSGTTNKFNLLVTDFRPFLSFFALNHLQDWSGDFMGIPDWASSMVFELYSFTDTKTVTTGYPSTDDLWVRFLFRNGTVTEEDENDNPAFMPHPLFNLDPDKIEMSWSSFSSDLATIALEPSLWCSVCEVRTSFCAAYDPLTYYYGGDSNGSRGMSNQVAGVIGAAATLGVLIVIFAAAMVLGGVRVHRSSPRNAKGLGGFKGGAKMASDADLVLPRHGAAIAGAEVEKGGHARMGSWELKGASDGLGGHSVRPMGDVARPPNVARRSSWGEDEDAIVNPFARPVQADERV